ncbi:MAG TPA: NAD-dependent malic enzyme [Actinotalea caeni]|uniref:NAD-dependent malic enzyme n=1 Tax=Actinotalea caeni TaxID=1348467 RepID=UPI002B4B33F0|nr:NAD-dependent malic enzyme [Actinotalea caeni]HLV55339.1 NAD-dependent malic enzyme [Actinotalea caeni]
MAIPSPSYSITIRVESPSGPRTTTALVAAVGDTGAAVTGIDVVESTGDGMVVDVSANARDEAHVEEMRARISSMDGFSVRNISDATFLMHLGGKLEVRPKVNLRHRDDLSRAYTPGVARVCLAIAARPEDARRLTIKRNTVAVVTDGTAVLGLGDIGAAAAMPVMEGKAALFKQFGDVDAWPVVLDTKDTEEIIRIVKAIAPAYGGVNLEDISAPRCFEIERRLREELDIPVFHDDQHGTAIVVLAALVNALKVVGKRMADVRIVVSGVGAAGSAIIRLLLKQGARHIVGYDINGAVCRAKPAPDENWAWIAEHTNDEAVDNTLREGLAGADVFIGVSAAGILTGADIATMADDAIVFALANPTPEVDPLEAAEHAAVVATGRSDYPNQINNVLAFPGIFRGLLDARAVSISDDVMRAAAIAIADVVSDAERNANFIVPSVFDPEVAESVARAVVDVVRTERQERGEEMPATGAIPLGLGGHG